MTVKNPPRPNVTRTDPRFVVKVSGRHGITLPAELRRHMDIEAGDTVEIVWHEWGATLHKVRTAPVPELMGLLSDYFTDWEDVQQFIEEERSGWEEREKNWS